MRSGPQVGWSCPPEQSPVQPRNIDPPDALAVSVTELPLANACPQIAPAPEQVSPPGVEVTVPEPVPPMTTVNG
jgi:hypothetical protein